MGKHYWQLYANYQAFGRLFKTIILWQLCKLHSYASNVELFIILYWYIYIALYWNILLWVLGGFLLAYFCGGISLAFCTYPHPQSQNFLESQRPEGVNFHRQHHHPLFFMSWRPPNIQAKMRCHVVIVRLPQSPVHILPFQNTARSSSQVMYSSTCPKSSSLCLFLSWEHNIFHCCYATECVCALSITAYI